MANRPPLRKVYYSPESEDDLFDLHADDDLDIIRAGILALAADPDLGDLMPFQSPFLAPAQKLYSFEIGIYRFKCKFDFDRSELEVASVEV